MNWTPELISDIETEINTAPHGQKKSVAQAHAERLGVSVATLYRHVNITGGKQKAPRDPEIPSHVIDLIAQAKAEPMRFGRNARQLTTKDAIDLLEQAGLIEEDSVSGSGADRRLRQRGFNKPRSYTRHEDDFVNQVHMMDFSRSEYFTVLGYEDDEWVLGVDGSQSRWSYKNKDKPKADRKRLWVVSYLDTYSRAWLVRYHASTGENLTMVTDFLRFAWQREDSDHPLKHLPLEKLKLDQGSLGKNKAFKRGMEERLGVRVELARPKNDPIQNEQSMGKIERRFRTLWQRGELKWCNILKKRGVETITLSQLNALAHQFCTKRMQRQHPVQNASIKQVYKTGSRLHKQRTVPEDIDLYTLFYSEDTRTVSATNDIQIDNKLYKVPEGYTMQKIHICRTRDGRFKGMSPDRSETFDLIPFDESEATGQRLHEKSYKELSADRGLDIDADKVALNGSGSDSGDLPDNVHTLGAQEEEQEPETPFSAKPKDDVFEDWEKAKIYICEAFDVRWKRLDDRSHDLLKRFFDKEVLSKQLIDDLAKSAS